TSVPSPCCPKRLLMRPSLHSWFAVSAATSLVASCGGTLIILADYFMLRFGAAVLESLSLLPSGWAANHFTVIAETAALVSVPIVAAMAYAFFRAGLRAEATMFNEPADYTAAADR